MNSGPGATLHYEHYYDYYFFSLILHARPCEKTFSSTFVCPAMQPELRCDGITALSTRSCGQEGARRTVVNSAWLTEAKKERPLLETEVGGLGCGQTCGAHRAPSAPIAERLEEGGSGWGGW